MCTYLQLHQGTYYFRRGVPAEMQHLFPTATGKPRTAWRWSLGGQESGGGQAALAELCCEDRFMDGLGEDGDCGSRALSRITPTDGQLASSQAIADQMRRNGLEAAGFFADQDRADEARGPGRGFCAEP